MCYTRACTAHAIVAPYRGCSENSALGCPLMSLTHSTTAYKVIKPADISMSVSFVHYCNDSCKFTTNNGELQFIHDSNNKIFQRNVFCIRH